MPYLWLGARIVSSRQSQTGTVMRSIAPNITTGSKLTDTVTWGGEKMPRLIDADAFFNDFPEMRDYEYASQNYEVDAEPVRHGRWLDVLVVDDDEGETDGVECSVCGYTDINVYWAKTYHRFCPNCGAKMGEIKDG